MPDRHHRSGAQGAPTRQHPGSRYPDMTWARRGEIVGTLLIFLVAVLIGVALRTPPPAPADFCSGSNHVSITATDARVVLNDLACR